MTNADLLIVDAMRARVLLYAEGDRLCFKAQHSLPPALADLLRSQKAEVLERLRVPEHVPPASDPPNATPPSDRPRDRAARLIRATRRSNPTGAVGLRDAWHERIAICTIEGGLTTAGAEAIAINELSSLADRQGAV